MSAPLLREFRVRFREWRTYAIDVPASTPEEAITTAQRFHQQYGAAEFAEITRETEDWQAEAQQPAPDPLPVLLKALDALNAVPRFQDGENDSHVKVETGGAA